MSFFLQRLISILFLDHELGRETCHHGERKISIHEGCGRKMQEWDVLGTHDRCNTCRVPRGATQMFNDGSKLHCICQALQSTLRVSQALQLIL